MHVFLFSRSVVSNYSPTGSFVHGISQARILESVAISSSRESSQPRDQIHISCVSCIGRQILYHWATWEVMQIYAHTQMHLVAFFWASKYYEKWPWKMVQCVPWLLPYGIQGGFCFWRPTVVNMEHHPWSTEWGWG